MTTRPSFIAILQTERHIERPVVLIRSNQKLLEGDVKLWLDSHGQHGDQFTLFEEIREPLGIIQSDKPEPSLPMCGRGSHRFELNPGSPDVCGVCGNRRP